MSADHAQGHGKQSMWALAVGAIGVVYGDIGTSPLYAFREALLALTHHGAEIARGDVFGILSLILWVLTLIVTIKYVIILLRIDNHGEGGTLALMALARSVIYRNTTFFLFLGMAGAALFMGDSMITPAISVLSAVEGIKVIAPSMEPFILPITIFIIFMLFSVQSKGTEKVSVFFGPITVIWFSTLGIMGFMHILDAPEILAAVNPYYAMSFIANHGWVSFFVLGSVFLAVTGAEALYADLGHFGRRPIQLAWGWFIFPALALNYLGQGALVLKNPEVVENLFFNMAPEGFQVPLVILATFATIIASQAVITGAFSLARQAVNLGLLPRLVIKHTSAHNSGQIYLPQINYLLMIGVILLTVLFKSSGALAGTYGISVTGAMVVDAIMAFFVLWQIREWKLSWVIIVMAPFLIIEGIFLGANLMKLLDGGWVPLLMAGTMMMMMTTWIQGSFIINTRARKRDIKLDAFIREYKMTCGHLARVPGTAFFTSSDSNLTPAAMIQNIKHNKVLHEKNVILSIKVEPLPHTLPGERAIVTHINDDFTVVVLRFGFKDDMDVQAELLSLNRAKNSGIDFDWQDTSIFISRRQLKSHARYGMPMWQDFIYVFMNKYASEPSDFYKLPASRVIEIGKHVMI